MERAMATELPVVNGSEAVGGADRTSFTVKTGLARMLQGGVIMDVVNAEQVYICPFTGETSGTSLVGWLNNY